MKKHNFISRKTIAIICLLSLVFGALPLTLSATEYVYDEPLESEMWLDANFDDPSTYAYSFAFVGDTQCLMIGDRLNGTNNVERLYKYVAGTAEERKLEHVFVLGDITEVGYWNDYNMVNAAKDAPVVTEEWEIAQKAIFQLNGKVKYSLCRGNHDDYMMDDYFNVPEYTDQFKGVGGFFNDSEAKHPQRREVRNPEGYIYWSALSGVHKESVVNSYMSREICGTKYLFVTLDFNPTWNVIKWIDELLPKYKDHKVIITTHSYLGNQGGLITTDVGSTMFPMELTAKIFWNEVYSKHENIFMIVSGHVGGLNLVYNFREGEKGNKVFEVLCNPQVYDAKEIDFDGTIEHGKQDTGLVLYMNFSEDGKKITFNYYSTLLGKFLKNNNYTFELD